MSSQQEQQPRTPKPSQAYTSFSKSPLSPRASAESPSTFSRRTSSLARHASLASQATGSLSDKQQEEAYFADLLSYR